MSTIELVVRSALPKAPTAEALRTALRRVDSQLTLYNVRTMADHVNRSLYLDQLRAVLISALAILALLIAAVGVYGLISYAVTERTRELGIRLALGATPGGVVRTLLRSGGRLAVSGVLLGGLIALWATRQAESMLYGVTRLDLWAWLGAASVLILIVQLATLVPALRATRVDPATTLRVE
jgi:ABC-type antimicrobial peptide transport system permease subunit